MGTMRRAWTAAFCLLALAPAASCRNEPAAPVRSSALLSTPAGMHIAPGLMLEHLRVVCKRHQTAAVSAHLVSQGVTVHAKGAVSWADELSGALRMRVAGMRYRAIVRDGLSYTASAHRPGTYARTDPAQLVVGVDVISQLNPCQVTESLLAKVDDVRYTGDQQVKGEQLRHYRLVVPAADDEGPQGQPEEPPAPDAGLAAGYTLWLDQDGLLRRLNMVTDGGSTSLLLKVSKYDVAVPLPRMRRIEQRPAIVTMLKARGSYRPS